MEGHCSSSCTEMKRMVMKLTGSPLLPLGPDEPSGPYDKKKRVMEKTL